MQATGLSGCTFRLVELRVTHIVSSDMGYMPLPSQADELGMTKTAQASTEIKAASSSQLEGLQIPHTC